MTVAQDLLDAEGKFDTDWAVAEPTVPVAKGNAPLTPAPPAPWVWFTLHSGEETHAELGPGQMREIGMVTVQVNVPIKTGALRQKQLEDAAKKIYRPTKASPGPIGNLRFEFGSRVEKAGDTDDGYYASTVIVPFRRDENFT